ncbi:MAG: deoxyribonuclease IV, partial [Lachnospiraceae bacterium]
MIFIGNHLSSSKGFEEMGKHAVALGGNTFAFFTRNPRGGKAKDIDPEDAKRLLDFMEEQKFGKLVAHAPYTMNLCAEKEEIRTFSLNMLKDDLQRMEYLPGNYYNFHPGSHVGQGSEKGIEIISDALNQSLWQEMTTTVLLETMAGKGSEVGRNFEELKAIIDRVTQKDKLGVCLDTCHIWDGGYDIVEHLDD